MFSTTKVTTRITKISGDIPSKDVVEALRQFYKLPVDTVKLEVTVDVPYETWDVKDCEFRLKWVEEEVEEETSDA